MHIEKLGLIEENIIDSNICTVCNSNLLHSYRKAGENSGRNMAIIEIKNRKRRRKCMIIGKT